MSRWRALSATVVVSRPCTAVCEPDGPGCGMRPWLGFRPTRPEKPGRDPRGAAAVARRGHGHQPRRHGRRAAAGRAARRAARGPTGCG